MNNMARFANFLTLPECCVRSGLDVCSQLLDAGQVDTEKGMGSTSNNSVDHMFSVVFAGQYCSPLNQQETGFQAQCAHI